MNTSDIKFLIAALRSETRQDSISPDSLGSILDKIVEITEKIAANSPLTIIELLIDTTLFPQTATNEQHQTLFLIDTNRERKLAGLRSHTQTEGSATHRHYNNL